MAGDGDYEYQLEMFKYQRVLSRDSMGEVKKKLVHLNEKMYNKMIMRTCRVFRCNK